MTEPLRAWIELDRGALINNARRARENTSASVMAVIKANAYGHGLEFAAKTLLPVVDAFAVATLDEATQLRGLIKDMPIICLSGFTDPGQIKQFESLGISLVVFNQAQIDWLEAHGAYQSPIWVKIDTGMTRLGLAPSTLESALVRLKRLSADIGMMSHFASADQPGSVQNERQHDIFKASAQALALPRSFCNSAALLTRPQDHYDFLRPGIMLYGSAPLMNKSARSLGLAPVMRLYARLIDIKPVAVGAQIGYGATWTAQAACKVGVVSIGYGDGYPRVVSDQAQLAIRGRRHTIIGRVSMDTLAVLLDDSEAYEIGDIAELWGDSISVDEVAYWANTIGYELLCKITNRPEKIII